MTYWFASAALQTDEPVLYRGSDQYGAIQVETLVGYGRKLLNHPDRLRFSRLVGNLPLTDDSAGMDG